MSAGIDFVPSSMQHGSRKAILNHLRAILEAEGGKTAGTAHVAVDTEK